MPISEGQKWDDTGEMKGFEETFDAEGTSMWEGDDLDQQSWIDRHALVYESMQEAVVISTSEGIITDLNPAAEDLFGWSRDEVTGRSVEILNDSKFASRNMKGIMVGLRRTSRWAGDFAARTKSGEVRVLSTVVCSLQEDGREVGIIGISRDITEQNKAKRDLQHRDAILEAIGFAAGLFLSGSSWEANIQAILQSLGEAADVSRVYLFKHHQGPNREKLFSQLYEWAAPGVSPEIDNPGLQNLDFTSAGLGRWEEILDSNRILASSVRDLFPSERNFLVTQSIKGILLVPITLRNQKLWGFIGFDETRYDREFSASEKEVLRTAADILGAAIEREAALQALGESEERYRQLIELSPEIILVHKAGLIQFANPAAIECFGAESPVQLLGRNMLDFIHPEEREMVLRRVRKVLAGNKPAPVINERLLRLDGSVFHAEVTAVPMVWEGEPAMQVVARDITEQLLAREALKESRERLQTLIDSTPDLIIFKDGKGRWLVANHTAIKIFGLEGVDFTGMTDFEIVGKTPERARALRYCEATDELAWNSDGPYRSEEIIPGSAPDHESLIFDVIKIPLRHSDGKRKGLVVLSRDVTERKRAERELERLASYPTLAPNPIVEIDLRGTLHFINPRARQIFPDLGEPGFEHPFLRGLEERITSSTLTEAGFITREIRIDDRWWTQNVHLVDQRSKLRIYAFDTTARKLTEEELRFDALHDHLTGLPNRSLFMDRLNQAVKRSSREAESRFAVLFLDIDDFKQINDTMGHHMGDVLLVEFSHRLRECVRPGDTVSRLGGDEFVVLVEDIKDLVVPTAIAERILESMSKPFQIGGRYVHSSPSIGIAMSREEGTGEDVLREADVAMYHAKDTGKNNFTIYDDVMADTKTHRDRWESELRQGLKDGRFHLLYQPLYQIRERNLTGFEALLRWNHPQRGTIKPHEFLHLADTTGLIFPLGWEMLKNVCSTALKWKETTGEKLQIHFNLSARQFQLPELRKNLEEVLAESCFEPDLVVIEIPEAAIMEQPQVSLVTIASLKEVGFRICLDDFGTGYTYLGFLQKIRFDYVKYDRALVRQIQESEEALASLKGLRALTRALKIQSIAIGVSNEMQLEIIQDCDLADYVQGHFLGEPVSEIEAEQVARAFHPPK